MAFIERPPTRRDRLEPGTPIELRKWGRPWLSGYVMPRGCAEVYELDRDQFAWFIEFSDTADGKGYHYWKQIPDGGTLFTEAPPLTEAEPELPPDVEVCFNCGEVLTDDQLQVTIIVDLDPGSAEVGPQPNLADVRVHLECPGLDHCPGCGQPRGKCKGQAACYEDALGSPESYR